MCPHEPPPPVVEPPESFYDIRYVRDESASYDIGSAGAQGAGNTHYIGVNRGGITVLGLSMDERASGRINFGVTASQITGADLRMWVSRWPDGERLSEACSYSGYAEGSLRAQQGACQLLPNGRYHINIAACLSGPEDYDCSSESATTADDDGRIVIEAKWRDQ